MLNSDSVFVTLGLTFGIGFGPTSGRRRRHRRRRRRRCRRRRRHRLSQSGKSSRTEFMNQLALLTNLCLYFFF